MKNRPYQAPCSAPTSGYRASNPEHSQVPASPGSTRGVGLREASRATSTAGVGVPAEKGGRAAREGSDGELGLLLTAAPTCVPGSFYITTRGPSMCQAAAAHTVTVPGPATAEPGPLLGESKGQREK